jgi:hypothetical protein
MREHGGSIEDGHKPSLWPDCIPGRHLGVPFEAHPRPALWTLKERVLASLARQKCQMGEKPRSVGRPFNAADAVHLAANQETVTAIRPRLDRSNPG